MENTPLVPPPSMPPLPSPKQQQWGALVSMVIIVLMIVVGAFYAWGKRIAKYNQYLQVESSQENQ